MRDAYVHNDYIVISLTLKIMPHKKRQTTKLYHNNATTIRPFKLIVFVQCLIERGENNGHTLTALYIQMVIVFQIVIKTNANNNHNSKTTFKISTRRYLLW